MELALPLGSCWDAMVVRLLVIPFFGELGYARNVEGIKKDIFSKFVETIL